MIRGVSVVVPSVGAATPSGDRKHVEYLLSPSSSTPGANRPDSEFLVWRTPEWVEVVQNSCSSVNETVARTTSKEFEVR
jgi:hypothetical protein